MGQSVDGLELSNIDRSSYRLRIICSLFNEKYTNRLLADSCSELKFYGIDNPQVKITKVPGALEIPFAISKISVYGNCDGILALGCILRGETYHFEVVANESARGIQEVSCNKNIPCINGVLTVENETQAFERSVSKGRSFAKALIYMVDLSKSLEKERKE
ncbi:MAG: 6,7-dimethyl-8-ribityllumazine synthase [Burkholderiaceae bacterium]|nr:MAG: 6,7-dimethyl-8-ribityllumazine synthase [Burkholderiaceae bacterium]